VLTSVRIAFATLVFILAGTLVGTASSELSGECTFWISFDPLAGTVEEMDLELDVSYTINDVLFSSESLVAYPGTWVWQGFTASGMVGAHAFESNILFGASTAEYLYAEAIVSLAIGGLSFSCHAAQLSDAVLGGPEGGGALRLSGGIGGFELVSVTEFGATIEDEDNDGISIVHIATGLERHYVTDPRPPGGEFTGQKVSLSRPDIFCADVAEGTLYVSCDGFEYVQVDLQGLYVGLPFIELDTELRFELEEKQLALTPTLSLGEVACVDVYGRVDWDPVSMQMEGIWLGGLEFACQLGKVVVRDVALFDLTEYVITTERFGSHVMETDAALEAGYDFYPDYWELLSVAGTGDSCCGEPFSFLANIYFDQASTNLFDWGMLHVEASIPLTAQVGITLGIETKPSSAEYIAFGVGIRW